MNAPKNTNSLTAAPCVGCGSTILAVYDCNDEVNVNMCADCFGIPINDEKIDLFFGESAERQKNKETVKTNKMNKQIKTNKTITCSTCGKTGHNKNNEKFHPDYKFTCVSVPTPVKINEDDLDLIIIKSPAPEPIPAVVVAPVPVKKTVPKPVFLNRKNRGECGVDGDNIAFPLLMMGCCEDPRGLVMTVTIPIPEKVDKKFFSGFADIVKKYPYFDWSGESFQRNIIGPNKEHIQMVMGLDDFFLKRVMEDLCVVINHWDKKEIDEDDSDYGEDYVPLNNETFFTDRKCEY